jgi:hypothetical protein
MTVRRLTGVSGLLRPRKKETFKEILSLNATKVPSSHNCTQATGVSTGQGCAKRTAAGGGRRALTRAERLWLIALPRSLWRKVGLQSYLRPH